MIVLEALDVPCYGKAMLPQVCPRCSLTMTPIPLGALEVCPECRGVVACAEEGSERHAQLPDKPGGCSRCRAEIPAGREEFCWFCLKELCLSCWELYGHCGHPQAIEANRKARAWKPGDPVLPAPWRES